MDEEQRSFLVTNEFASVRVELDADANGPRLRVTDLSSGVYTCFDPLELEALAWTLHKDLAAVLDPNYRSDLLEAIGAGADVERLGEPLA